MFNSNNFKDSMRKKIFTLVGLFVLSVLSLSAQTLYLVNAEANSKVNSKLGTVFTVDLADPTVVGEVLVSEAEEYGYVNASSVLAGNILYAVTDAGVMRSYNCATGDVLELGSLRISSLDAGSLLSIHNLCYDNSTEKLYVVLTVRKTTKVDGTTTETDRLSVCEISTKDFTLKEVVNIWDSSTGTTKPTYKSYMSDNNGGFYVLDYAKDTSKTSIEAFWYKLITLHKLNLADGTINLAYDFGSVKESSIYATYNMVKYDDDTMYVVGGSTVAELDLKNSTFTFVAKDNGTNGNTALGKGTLTVAGVLTEKSTEHGVVASEPVVQPVDPYETKNMVLKTENYGDFMGMVPDDEVSAYVMYYYDSENKLTRRARYAWQQGGTDDYGYVTPAGFEITDYYHLDYDENGRLIKEWSEQYGLFGNGANPLTDKIWKTSDNWTAYEYNEAGQKVKMIPGLETRYTAYEYDESGNLVKESEMCQDTSDYYQPNGDYTDWYLLKGYTYSDFIAPNCPQKVVADGYFSGNRYEADIKYDEQNRKIEEHQYKPSDKPDEEATKTFSFYYTYNEDGVMIQELRTKWSYTETNGWVELNKSKTEYTPQVDDTSRVKTTNYSWDTIIDPSNPHWVVEGTTVVTEYSDFNGQYSCEIEVENVPEEINTAKVWLTVPANAAMFSYAFDVYCYGMYKGRVLSSDAEALDEETGRYFFVDKNLKNGTYDYFVQTVTFDELDQMEKGRNISNYAIYTADLQLPAPQNLRAVSKRYEKTSYTDPYEGTTAYYNEPYVTIEWDAPENMENYEFLRYNVYLGNGRVADNMNADGQATTWEFAFGTADDFEDVRVEAVYRYGISATETITFDINDIPNAVVEDNDIYSIAGSFNGWSIDANQFTAQGDGLYTITLDELYGDFKFVKNTKDAEMTWDVAYGSNGEALAIDADYVPSLEGGNILLADDTVIYKDVTISIQEGSEDESTITVLVKANGTEAKEVTYELVGAFNNWTLGANYFETTDNTTWILHLDQFAGEFKVVKDKVWAGAYTFDGVFEPNTVNTLVGPADNCPNMTVGDNTYEDVKFTLITTADAVTLEFTPNVSVESLEADTEFTVYNYQGILLLNKADKAAVDALPAGFYIINGKKVAIK